MWLKFMDLIFLLVLLFFAVLQVNDPDPLFWVGLYVVATHSGVTLSPALGKLMAEVIAEDRVPEELAPFGLERFQAFA